MPSYIYLYNALTLLPPFFLKVNEKDPRINTL